MPLEFQRVDPHAVRDDVVDFFWKHRRWPGETKEDYYAIWDWRYTALSEGPAVAYIARLKDTGEIVGHVGAYRRDFRFGDADLKICVPGNLFVHPDWQQRIVGVRMVMFLRSLVQNREFDAVLGFGNKTANAMLERLRFAQFGAMHTYVEIRDAGPVLRRKHEALAALAPVVNLGFAARRLRSTIRGGAGSPLRVTRLTPNEFMATDRSHWASPNRLVAWESNQFIVQRYLREPGVERHIYGLFDSDASLLQGFVVTEPTARIKVWDCQTNSSVLDSVDAISAVGKAVKGAETVLVPTMPQSRLARELVQRGFLDRESVDLVESQTYLSAYWLDDNQHAAVLRDPSLWNIWLGSRHY
jgi:hypothetical protein